MSTDTVYAAHLKEWVSADELRWLRDTVHIHHWKRWPVVDLALDYSCADCGERERIVWVTEHAGKSINDLDQMVAAHRGGVFAGEMFPQR